jgi:AcrR family transcriptional regulator
MRRNTRSLLIAAAAELLDAGGPAAVTLRDVGGRAGVSHNAPYKHFSDKEELLAAVASRELSRQAKTLSGMRGEKSPRETLRAVMHAYVRWAMTHPQRFKLIFGAWRKSDAGLGEAADASRGALIRLVTAAQDAHELVAGDAERITSLFLAVGNGAADLALNGHLAASGKGHADPEDLIDDLILYLSRSAARPRKRTR